MESLTSRRCTYSYSLKHLQTMRVILRPPLLRPQLHLLTEESKTN